MKAIVNNIYSIGDYFFIDYSLQNSTKIAYDIAEVRVKLTDKKEVKATNSQTVELSPVYSLNLAKKFKKNYRNVLVLDKLTFPDEKVLRIEISENQISGRVIVFSTAAIYGPGVTCHFRLRHGYLRIDVGVQTGVWHTVDRGGTRRGGGIYHTRTRRKSNTTPSFTLSIQTKHIKR